MFAMSNNDACWWPLINPAGAMASEHLAAEEVNGGFLRGAMNI
jgi:hypothetical protein